MEDSLLGRKRVVNVAAERCVNDSDLYRDFLKVGDHLNGDLDQCSDVVLAVILYPITNVEYDRLEKDYPFRDGVPVHVQERIAQLLNEGRDCSLLHAYMDQNLCHVPLVFPPSNIHGNDPESS